MLIDCPSCARSYHVSRSEIGDGGRAVICPRCHTSWLVDAEGRRCDAEQGPMDLLTTAVSERPVPSAAEPEFVAPRRSLLRRGLPAMTAAACLLIAMGAIGARDRVVRVAPRTASLYAAMGLPVNVRGLTFASVASSRPEPGSTDVIVRGEIRNVAQGRVRVPRLSYEVRDASGASVAAWTEAPPARSIAADAMVSFMSRPHALPPEARTVLVRFDGGSDSAPRTETVAAR